MKIGSLFSGAGGLDLAVEAVFGATTAWHCEIDPAASKVLAHRWPGVPNLGDITTIGQHPKVGWDYIEPVDILCGGYPCQPFSAAGRRKGTNDERHLWPYFAEAIRHLRPRYVVLENVAGHRSVGFDRVLADLAGLRYDTQWCSLRASDIGAPHRRERLFVVAHASGAAVGQPTRSASSQEAGAPSGDRPSDCGGERAAGNGWPAADSACVGWGEGRPEPARLKRGSDAAVSGTRPVELLPTPRSADGNGGGNYNSPGHQDTLPGTVRLLPTPTSRDYKDSHSSATMAAKSQLTGIAHYLPTPTAQSAKHDADDRGPGTLDDFNLWSVAARIGRDALQWGKYEPAIRRWETLTRPAPSPTEPNTKGNPRLSAAFSEWMMGWPAGWVTAVPGISRNDALRCIGNGVIPQQAVAALRWLLSVSELAA